MGTTYAVEAVCPGSLPRERVDGELARINRLMSTYDPDSELSRFNRSAVGADFGAAPETVEVVAAALAVAERSGGALDPTVAPLVALWGFGADPASEPPRDSDIAEAMASVGHRKLVYRRDPPSLRKLAPVTVDLSAIAKGYAVDRLAAVLADARCDAYLIELGGEIRAFGRAPGGGPWRIGVDVPSGTGFAATISLENGGLATSGDYRQFRQHDGVRLSHIIDPRTGYPVDHGVASVTVVADTAMMADAHATALLVMGEEGLAFAEANGLAALFIVRTADGFRIAPTAAMAAYTR